MEHITSDLGFWAIIVGIAFAILFATFSRQPEERAIQLLWAILMALITIMFDLRHILEAMQ